MKRIKEKRLKKIIKNYKGVMIGYSAGAMIQLDSYHISQDEDYPEFSYQTGLGCLSGFDIEPHFRKSKIQIKSIEKVQEEKQIPIYGIYENGGIIVDKSITCFGKVDKF
jgi:cyanophycinase